MRQVREPVLELSPPSYILSGMSDQGSDDDQVAQRFDALLLKQLKTPPQSRAEVAEAARRATEKPKRGRPKSQGRKRSSSPAGKVSNLKE